MDIDALRTELLAGHPDTGPYDANPRTAADQLNAVNRNLNRELMSGDAVFEATDSGEFTRLNNHKQLLWVTFTSREVIDPFAGANLALIREVFGAGSTTEANLNTSGQQAVSRAVELGLGRIKPGHVIEARQ